MLQKRLTKARPIDEVEDADDEPLVEDDEDQEGGKVLANSVLVSRFIRMWPRAIFDTPAMIEGHRGKQPSIAMTIKELERPGVYILYIDDQPFYVGQAQGKLRSRLRAHANGVGGLRSYFWNYFSAFIVENPKHIDEVEAILISAMPSVITNSSKPKLPRVRITEPIRRRMRELRKNGQY
ncbi:MAG: GIY-YIG nuclease family protein [Terracidiphilus sp.]|jgi:hypothetical protein